MPTPLRSGFRFCGIVPIWGSGGADNRRRRLLCGERLFRLFRKNGTADFLRKEICNRHPCICRNKIFCNTLAISNFCSIITSNLNWRKSVWSLLLFDADEDSLYLALGTGLNCYVPNRVIKKSLPFILLLMAYSC